MPRRKLIFLGSDTFFSQAVLRHLVQAGALIMRVIIPSLPFHVEVGFPVPQRQPHGLAAICGSLGIPLETIDPINPDSLCVFSKGSDIRRITGPHIGCIQLAPLPAAGLPRADATFLAVPCRRAAHGRYLTPHDSGD
jgi:hypothetical protein